MRDAFENGFLSDKEARTSIRKSQKNTLKVNIYKLVDYKNNLERGLVLRCKGKYPYEEVVDFIITESYMDDKGYSL